MAGGASERFDVAVVGAGIAGASVAYELAAAALQVLLLERESQPGYHTTGRSAALFSAIYGPATIRALTRASAPFFDNPPPDFFANPPLTPRGVLMIARPDQLTRADAVLREVSGRGAVRLLDARQVQAMMPLLREGYAAGAVLEEAASDVDVHALHQGYLGAFRAAGGRTETGREVMGLSHDGESWRIETRNGEIGAGIVINAAGAWADELACMAGVRPTGLVPKRRTALIVPAPNGADSSHWPMVVDIDEQFYLKPESGRLLISPADETPSPPCDTQPEEIDIAVCVDRIEKAFDLRIARVENKWAGLRTFARDGTPVVGFDPIACSFFWLAGQGGYGIQSAPAVARLAAALVQGRAVPSDIADEGATEAALAPSRLERAA